MKTPEKTPARKPYKTPVLEKYGDIRKLTQQTGNMGMNDPPGDPTKRSG